MFLMRSTFEIQDEHMNSRLHRDPILHRMRGVLLFGVTFAH